MKEDPIQDQPKWWRVGRIKDKKKEIKIQSRTNLNGGELERIRDMENQEI